MVHCRRPGQDAGPSGEPGGRGFRGKHKPTYTPHVDSGDYVIVINAKDVRLTGKKLDKKIYYRHSRYPGGLKMQTAGEMLETRPEKMVQLAVGDVASQPARASTDSQVESVCRTRTSPRGSKARAARR